MKNWFIYSLLAYSGVAYSQFETRGENIVYDRSTNLTWVRSAMYAQTNLNLPGIDPSSGKMSFTVAKAWVSGLSVPDTRTGNAITDWRLPSVQDLAESGCERNGSDSIYAYTGLYCGYVGSGTGASEIAKLLSLSLGYQPGQVPTKFGPFSPLLPGVIWLDSPYSLSAADQVSTSILTVEGWLVRSPSSQWPPSLVWGIYTDGFQGPAWPNSAGYAWAVQTGDALPVPEVTPATMLMIGIATLYVLRRRKN